MVPQDAIPGAERSPLIGVKRIEQAAGARHALPYGTILRAGTRGHSAEVGSTLSRPLNNASCTHREGVQELRAASCAGEQSVEPVRAAAAERCRPSASTAQCSARPWEQPGEEQEAPFCDHPVHRGSRLVPMAVLERIPCALVASPCDQRLVVGGPRAVGSARPAGKPWGARGSLVTKRVVRK